MINRILVESRIALTKKKNLFPFIHRATNRNWGKFCDYNTKLCIEGFESSANSFTYNVIRCVWPSIKVGHHKHVVANLKRAYSYEIPTVVLYRNPEDAIPSLVSRFRPDSFEAVRRYIHFYRYVEDIAPDVLLVSFEEATQKVRLTVERIANFATLPLDGRSLANLEERAKASIREQTKERGNVEQISLPKEEREIQKEKVREKMRRMPDLEEAKRIYNHIRKLHSKQENNLRSS